MKKLKNLIVIIGVIIISIILFRDKIFRFINPINEIIVGASNQERRLAYDENVKFEDNKSKIKDIQCGENYTVILKEDGTVWVTGENYHVNDIIKVSGERNTKFTKMRIENIIQIAVGDNFVLALNKDGDVYSWGGNDYHQLGIEEASRTCYEVPRKVEIKNIEKIYAFNLQSAALSKDGIAYYWGYATDTTSNKPVIKKFNKEIIDDIFLTNYKYYFKTTNNELYGAGYDFDNITSQVNGWARQIEKVEIYDVKKVVSSQKRYNLENANNIDYVIKQNGDVSMLNVYEGELETKIEVLSNIVDAKTFLDNRDGRIESVIFLDNLGNVYTNIESSLDGDNISDNIKKINLSNVKEIYVGAERNSSQSCVIIQKENNTIWNLASSIENYQRREGGWSPSRCYEAEQINIDKFKDVAFGEEYIIVIDQNDVLYRKGYNSVGQLGTDKQENISEFDLIYTSNMNYHFDKRQELLNNKTPSSEEMNNNITTNNNITNNSINIKPEDSWGDVYDITNSDYGTTKNDKDPYWVKLENGKYILIDPVMSTMGD